MYAWPCIIILKSLVHYIAWAMIYFFLYGVLPTYKSSMLNMIKERRATLAMRCLAEATLSYQSMVTIAYDHNA